MLAHYCRSAGLAVALIFSTAVAIAGLATGARADMTAPVPTVHYRTAKIDGIDIFYREAGPADAPVVVLLHGFPTSSHMFRNLIPLLADRYRVIAPDYPGFGQSAMPDHSDVRLHLRPLRRHHRRPARPARRHALRDLRHGLRRARSATGSR